jgi:hypothetical protein
MYMCFTRGFCSRDGIRGNNWEHTQLTGNTDTGNGTSFYLPLAAASSARTSASSVRGRSVMSAGADCRHRSRAGAW